MQWHGGDSADGNITPMLDGDNAAATVLDCDHIRDAYAVVARPAARVAHCAVHGGVQPQGS